MYGGRMDRKDVVMRTIVRLSVGGRLMLLMLSR